MSTSENPYEAPRMDGLLRARKEDERKRWRRLVFFALGAPAFLWTITVVFGLTLGRAAWDENPRIFALTGILMDSTYWASLLAPFATLSYTFLRIRLLSFRHVLGALLPVAFGMLIRFFGFSIFWVPV